MILPIYIYGQPVLRKVAEDVDVANYPNLKELIDNMFETMYHADGIGLAAPQVGLAERIFVVDLSPLAGEEHPEFKEFKKVFINAHITERSGALEQVEEGCLSLPGIHENVPREEKITIAYLDEDLQPREEDYSGFLARVIQHEYDHLMAFFYRPYHPASQADGEGKLAKMERGKVECHYKIRPVTVR